MILPVFVFGLGHWRVALACTFFAEKDVFSLAWVVSRTCQYPLGELRVEMNWALDAITSGSLCRIGWTPSA